MSASHSSGISLPSRKCLRSGYRKMRRPSCSVMLPYGASITVFLSTEEWPSPVHYQETFSAIAQEPSLTEAYCFGVSATESGWANDREGPFIGGRSAALVGLCSMAAPSRLSGCAGDRGAATALAAPLGTAPNTGPPIKADLTEVAFSWTIEGRFPPRLGCWQLMRRSVRCRTMREISDPTGPT